MYIKLKVMCVKQEDSDYFMVDFKTTFALAIYYIQLV